LGRADGRTRAKVISVLRDFFAWAVREGRLTGNPAIPIFRPRRRETARGTFTASDTARLVAAQTRQRDRVALLLLFRLGAPQRRAIPSPVQALRRQAADCLREGRQGALSAGGGQRASARA
jgi:site-specific recombinase XerD